MVDELEDAAMRAGMTRTNKGGGKRSGASRREERRPRKQERHTTTEKKDTEDERSRSLGGRAEGTRKGEKSGSV